MTDITPDTTPDPRSRATGPAEPAAGCGRCCDAPATDVVEGSAGADRRTLFRRASMVALAGGGAVALAACGGTSNSTSSGATSARGGDTGSSTPAGGASSSSTETSSSPSGKATKSAETKPSGTEFAKSDVPVGGGVIKDKLVVTQPTSGEFKAFSAVCTHQGCLVTQIQDGLIMCPCHRSEFSIKDGSVQRGPAPSPLPSKTVTASGSDVFVS